MTGIKDQVKDNPGLTALATFAGAIVTAFAGIVAPLLGAYAAPWLNQETPEAKVEEYRKYMASWLEYPEGTLNRVAQSETREVLEEHYATPAFMEGPGLALKAQAEGMYLHSLSVPWWARLRLFSGVSYQNQAGTTDAT